MAATETTNRPVTWLRRTAIVLALVLVAVVAAIGFGIWKRAPHTDQPAFDTPEAAVRALNDAVKAGSIDAVINLFGPDSRELAESSDPATGRHNREVFTVAMAEGWHLADNGPGRKVVVIGNEQWPFPVPLVQEPRGWRFDTASGREEVLNRRIGRNELAVIEICRTYVGAQKRYAQEGHDGKPAGIYAQSFRSNPGTENGLYWAAARGKRLSPLGDLVAQAAEEGRVPTAPGRGTTPFHGYYFKILTAQGAAATGGAKSYVVNDAMTGGFALLAWPAQYGATGVMAFIVNQDGVVFEKDLGTETETQAKAIADYNPDDTWSQVKIGW